MSDNSISTIKKAIIPINNLSFTVLGNVIASVDFNFNAEILIFSDLENLLSASKLSLDNATDNLQNLSQLINTSLITPSSTTPQIIHNNTNTIVVSDSFFQSVSVIEKTNVTISGTLKINNDSNLPVTVTIFAEAVTINNTAQTLHFINTDKLIICKTENADPSRIIPLTTAKATF